MAYLSLLLLGAFEATLDGEPVAGFESAKVRALLAYLAVEADRLHRRETLAGLLWPERPEQAARHNLRHALSTLRKAIGDRPASGDTAYTERRAPPFLLVTRETVRFNPASDHWLDVAAFRASAEAGQEDQSAVRRWGEAVALYRGSFLEGFSVRGSPAFEDWALLTRERLRRQAAAALQRLVAAHELRGEAERACEYARRRVDLEQWQEEAHRQLMRLLALSGQRSAALAQYEVCQQVLAEELGVEPEAKTATLYERIRTGALAPPAKRPVERAAVEPRPETAPPPAAVSVPEEAPPHRHCPLGKASPKASVASSPSSRQRSVGRRRCPRAWTPRTGRHS